jgi:conjugal transfer pilus assembly protein TrbC
MRQLLALILLSLISQMALAGDDTLNMLESVNQATSNAEKLQKQLDVPRNKFEKQGQEQAEEISSFYYSDAFQNKLSAERERLKATVFKDYVPEQHYIDSVQEQPHRDFKQILGPSERIYVFISSSVPVETLRAYVRDIDCIGDSRIVLVMNGFVEGIGSFKKMLDFIVSIKSKDPDCSLRQGECSFFNANLQIDPLLFKKYRITAVPAVVYARGGTLANADRPDHEAQVSEFYLIKGDASFESQIESIRRESKSITLENILASLRGGFYNGK